jgi:4'-phosphopantetheinyl transferase EntD
MLAAAGHPIGCATAVAALALYADPAKNPALAPGGDRLLPLWPEDLVDDLSHHARVASVVALGRLQTPGNIGIGALWEG